MTNNKALKELIDANPVLYRDSDFVASVVSQLSFDKMYDLYSQQVPDHENILDDEKVVSEILNGSDDGKKLVMALFASDNFFNKAWTPDTVLKVANISSAHKKALLSNRRIDWYRINVFDDKKTVIEHLFKPTILGEDQWADCKILFQNPRTDRRFLARVISGKDEYSSIDIRQRIYLGVEALKAREIKSYDWPGKDQPDDNDMYFKYPHAALLDQIKIVTQTNFDEPWLQPIFTRELIGGYLAPYSLSINNSDWIEPKEKEELSKIEDWNTKFKAENKAAEQGVLKWLEVVNGQLEKRPVEDHVEYYSEEMFYIAIAYKLLEGDEALINEGIKSSAPIVRAGAYAAKFDKEVTTHKSFLSYLKKSISQKDYAAFIKGVSLSKKFWNFFQATMKENRRYMWCDDLLDSLGIKYDEDSIWGARFCKGIFISDEKEEEIINSLDALDSIEAVSSSDNTGTQVFQVLEHRLFKQEKKIKWIFWMVVIILLLMFGQY